MISKDKKYRYKGFVSVVEILATSRPAFQSSAQVISMDTDGTLTYHAANGWSKAGDKYCLVEVTPWDDIKINDPVMVRDKPDQKWIKRHFAGIDHLGFPLAFIEGCTSWTSFTPANPWRECRKATDEELAAKC